MVTQRGRQSLSAQVLLGVVPLGFKERPGIPDAFRSNSPEAALWRTIVAAESADWFHPGDIPLLEAFCRATINYRKVTVKCASAPYTLTNFHGAQSVNPIFRMQDMLAKQMAALATKLRLAQSTRVSAHQAGSTVRKNATTEAGLKPWQRES